MSNQITTLLFKQLSSYQSVTLDGVGSLVCNSVGAEIDAENGKITPPHHTVTFESSLNYTSLISIIEKQLSLSAIEASRSYSKWLKQNKKTSDNTTTYTFEGVGNLILESKGENSFTSDNQLLLLLSPLAAQQIINSNIDMKKEITEPQAPKTEEAPKATSAPKPTAKPAPKATAKPAPKAAAKPAPKSAKTEEESGPNKTIIGILVVLLLVAVALVIYFFQPKPKEVVKEVVVETVVETPPPVVVEPEVVEEVKIETVINNGKYHIITGMFINESGAQATVAKAKQNGYSEAFYEFLPHVNKFGVSIKSFEHKADAQAELNAMYYKVAIESDNDMMWIYDATMATKK